MTDSQQFQERVGRIDALVHKLDLVADPSIRSAVKDLVQSLMELHGAGIERMLEILSSRGEGGANLIDSLGRDELVSSLLVLYNLHPDDFGTRVHRALEKLRPVLRSESAHLEVIEIADGKVHVRIQSATEIDVRSAVRDALYSTAPDATDVVIEGGQPRGKKSSFVPLTSLLATDGTAVLTAGSVRS